MKLPVSIPHIADVELIRGAQATGSVDLLVEVPHGASLRAHYDQLAAQLSSELPADLHHFFHCNTDTGAWEYGRRTAELMLAAHPNCSALVVRCLIPRTFIDTNRRLQQATGLGEGGVTRAIQPYVTDSADHSLLIERHQQYTSLAQSAWTAVVGAGGLGLIPHSYMPRTLDIERVDADIVTQLHASHEPARYAACPLRAQVELITQTSDGVDLSPPGSADRLVSELAAAGLTAEICGTFHLHEATMGFRWSEAYPHRVLCLEVRRDLLVQEWTPFAQQMVDPQRVERVAGPLAQVLGDYLAP